MRVLVIQRKYPYRLDGPAFVRRLDQLDARGSSVVLCVTPQGVQLLKGTGTVAVTSVVED